MLNWLRRLLSKQVPINVRPLQPVQDRFLWVGDGMPPKSLKGQSVVLEGRRATVVEVTELTILVQWE